MFKYIMSVLGLFWVCTAYVILCSRAKQRRAVQEILSRCGDWRMKSYGQPR